MILCMFSESFFSLSVVTSNNESLKISEMFSTQNNGELSQYYSNSSKKSLLLLFNLSSLQMGLLVFFDTCPHAVVLDDNLNKQVNASWLELECFQKRILGNVFFQIQVSYCPPGWMCHQRTLYNKMNMLHEKCFRIIHNDTKSIVNSSRTSR